MMIHGSSFNAGSVVLSKEKVSLPSRLRGDSDTHHLSAAKKVAQNQFVQPLIIFKMWKYSKALCRERATVFPMAASY